MGKFIWIRVLSLLLLAYLNGACHHWEDTAADAVELSQEEESQKNQIFKRGKLICGIDGNTPGFSAKNARGKYYGFDVDICRAVAAALFDNTDAISYLELKSNERFSAVALGDVDLLSRTTTVTLKRDSSSEVDFPAITLYDGLGVMVHSDSGIKNLKDFHHKAICFHNSSTTELNLLDEMRDRRIEFYPVRFSDKDNSLKGYLQKRCHAIARDRSQLFALKRTLEQPSNHLILDEIMSKEPLALAVKEDDRPWFQTVRWIVYALIEAEELGINSANLENMTRSENPEIKRFLGMEGDLGDSLGLPNDFTQRIIRHVGNYGEIYERNLGKLSPFQIPRGMNNLWSSEGLHYSAPFR